MPKNLIDKIVEDSLVTECEGKFNRTQQFFKLREEWIDSIVCLASTNSLFSSQLDLFYKYRFAKLRREFYRQYKDKFTEEWIEKNIPLPDIESLKK